MRVEFSLSAIDTAAAMPPAAAKSDFLRKFENRLSVVGRDGSVCKVGEPASSGPAMPAVDESGEMGGITHLHPALVDALLGKEPPPRIDNGMGARRNVVAPSPPRASVARSSLGSFSPPSGQVTLVQPPVPQEAEAGRRVVKSKPSAGQLHALAQEESARFGFGVVGGGGNGGNGGKAAMQPPPPTGGTTFSVDASGQVQAASSSGDGSDVGAAIQMHSNHAELLGLGFGSAMAPEPTAANSPAAASRQRISSITNAPMLPGHAGAAGGYAQHPPVSRMAYGSSQLAPKAGAHETNGNHNGGGEFGGHGVPPGPLMGLQPEHICAPQALAQGPGPIWPVQPTGAMPPGMPLLPPQPQHQPSWPLPNPAFGYAPAPPQLPPPMPHPQVAPANGAMVMPPHWAACAGFPGVAAFPPAAFPFPMAGAMGPPQLPFGSPVPMPEACTVQHAAHRGSRRATAPTALPPAPLEPPAPPVNMIGGRRAQRSAPSSRFVSDERQEEHRSGGRRRDRSYAAPHTADGVPTDHNKGGGGGGSGTAPAEPRGSGLGYKPYTGKISKEYMNLGHLKCAAHRKTIDWQPLCTHARIDSAPCLHAPAGPI